MKKLFIAVIVSSVLFSFSTIQAADKAAGKVKYAVCASCHGKDGKSTNPIYPKLNGQHAGYIVSSLKAYKNNERGGANAAQMLPFAALLNESDMKNIAAYLADI